MTTAGALLLLLVAGTLPGVVRWMLPPLPESAGSGAPGAVVVLGGGNRRLGNELAPSRASLRRARFGTELARERRLPVLLSGGGCEAGPSEAALMAALIERHWPDMDIWREERSRTTWENAVHSAALLRGRGVHRVLLVTDRPHLTRATLSFRAQGLDVVPVSCSSLPEPDWVPSAGALAWLPEVYYEWVGLFWYQIRYL